MVASAAGMSAALYFIAAAIAWRRVAVPVPSDSRAQRVMLDRAVAWTGLFVLFATLTALKLQMAEWSDDTVDLVLFLALTAVYVAGLVSVRAITGDAYGHRVLAVFAGLSLGVGLLILIL